MDSSLLIGLLGLVALVALIAIRLPIAYAMILVGGVGTMILTDPRIFLAQLKNLAYSQFSIYDLSVLPM
ncbi:MAG: C4-dicarboxylate ABC transporter permease, partial [Betaproteobacteria bacterium]|nr:C4-dicarboxylate ABC transporter permease [Betaproteobacteria bacterium]